MRLPSFKNLSPRARRLALHDLAIFGAALASTGIVDQVMKGGADRTTVIAAVIVAVKITLRKVLPVPAQALLPPSVLVPKVAPPAVPPTK